MDLERIKNLESDNDKLKEISVVLGELENLKNQPNNEPDEAGAIEALNNFKQEIWRLKREEEQRQLEDKSHSTVHLNDVNPDELIFDDMKMYEKIIINEKFTLDDLGDFNKKLRQEDKKMEERNIPKSRILFGAFLFNKGNGFLMMTKEREKRKIFNQQQAA